MGSPDRGGLKETSPTLRHAHRIVIRHVVWRDDSVTSAKDLLLFTRDDIREAVERAGDEHWDALRRHHEDAYPNPKPTPGDVCKGEAERLNQLGLGDAKEFELLETRVERVGDNVRLTHVFKYKPLGVRLLTEPFQDYK